ncbi:MAG: hypothetical protein ACYDHF_05985 [Candidatus Cryosericum sp.]
MNISTLNNLDSDVWRMILDHLYVPERQKEELRHANAVADDVAEQHRAVPVPDLKAAEK